MSLDVPVGPPAELKGHNTSADAYKSQTWFTARADCTDVMGVLQTVSGTFLYDDEMQVLSGSWESWIYPLLST